MCSKKREGIVYSTNPDFNFNEGSAQVPDTLPPDKQWLYVWIEAKGRGGKTVTLVKGFAGKTEDLETLAGHLKKYCGTGGSVKDGEIIIQGQCRDKVIQYLSGKGYKTKKAGG